MFDNHCNTWSIIEVAAVFYMHEHLAYRSSELSKIIGRTEGSIRTRISRHHQALSTNMFAIQVNSIINKYVSGVRDYSKDISDLGCTLLPIVPKIATKEHTPKYAIVFKSEILNENQAITAAKYMEFNSELCLITPVELKITKKLVVK